MAMSARSKIIVGGIGFSMMLQNYTFFLAYWDLYSQISQASTCAGTSWWLGYSALVCAMETVFACGMMLGGWIDGSKVLWWIFFVLHLIDALPGYTLAVIKLGTSINSADGMACAAAYPSVGDASYSVWLVQAIFYAFYCCFMIGQFYMVVIRKEDEQGPFLGEIDNDKLVVFGLGLMMMVQNFSFALTFWGLFMEIPRDSGCAGTWWWLGYNSIVCAIETVFAGGMMLGGWIDGSKVLFWIFWVLHLIDAVPGYTLAVIKLGTNIKSADGVACAEAYPGVGRRSNEVWLVQVAWYVFYCFCMLGITYMSAIKTYMSASKKEDSSYKTF